MAKRFEEKKEREGATAKIANRIVLVASVTLPKVLLPHNSLIGVPDRARSLRLLHAGAVYAPPNRFQRHLFFRSAFSAIAVSSEKLCIHERRYSSTLPGLPLVL